MQTMERKHVRWTKDTHEKIIEHVNINRKEPIGREK